MGNILNKIIENNLIFGCVIGVLVIILIILVILIVRSVRENHRINIYEEELEDEDIKKVKNVKKEDIIEVPDFIDDDEEEIIEKPKKKEIKTEIYEDDIDEEIEERYSKEKEKEISEVKEENHNEHGNPHNGGVSELSMNIHNEYASVQYETHKTPEDEKQI